MRTFLKKVPVYEETEWSIYIEDDALRAMEAYKQVEETTCCALAIMNHVDLSEWDPFAEDDPGWKYLVEHLYHDENGLSGFLVLMSPAHPEEAEYVCTSMDQMDLYVKNSVEYIRSKIRRIAARANRVAKRTEAVKQRLLRLECTIESIHRAFINIDQDSDVTALEYHLSSDTYDALADKLIMLEEDIKSIAKPIRRFRGSSPLEEVWNSTFEAEDKHVPYRDIVV